MKISIIGAGNVGSAVAMGLIERGIGNEIVLMDIIEGMPQGKALDMYESTPIIKKDIIVRGSNNFGDVVDSSIVVITAGYPRKPGMSRIDLLKANIDIIKPVTENIKKKAGDAILIVVTNPLDIMTYTVYKLSGFDRKRVMGMAGVLDCSRFKSFLALELGVSVEDVHAMVLGGHGDAMVPLPRFSAVSGIPVTELLSSERINALVQRTRNGGVEIVNLLKTGSAYYAPGLSVVNMVEAIMGNRKRLLPACVYLDGEYGHRDVCVGVPVVISREGVERVVELKLRDEEKDMLNKSVSELYSTIKEMKENGLI